MKVLAASILAITRVASAESLPWNVEVGVRATGSVAVGDTMMSRSGVAPSLVVRVQRQIGFAYLGANLGVGLPAYVGQHEASFSIGLAHTLRGSHCLAEQCDARVVLLGGIDSGVALLAYDAPPELASSDDALLYWGPFGRARVAVRASWPAPTGNELGVTVGAGLAITSAHYLTTATGTGLRLEPELDVAAVIGF